MSVVLRLRNCPCKEASNMGFVGRPQGPGAPGWRCLTTTPPPESGSAIKLQTARDLPGDWATEPEQPAEGQPALAFYFSNKFCLMKFPDP